MLPIGGRGGVKPIKGVKNGHVPYPTERAKRVLKNKEKSREIKKYNYKPSALKILNVMGTDKHNTLPLFIGCSLSLSLSYSVSLSLSLSVFLIPILSRSLSLSLSLSMSISLSL